MSETSTDRWGPAQGATIEVQGETWTLVLMRQLRQPPERVWKALTEPGELRHWSPFDADQSLAVAGTVARLTTVGPGLVSQTTVLRAEEPHTLQFTWGDRELRWHLEASGGGTRLTLWNNIDRAYIAMGAAGWHVCLDVLDRWTSGETAERLIGEEARQSSGWQRLHREYRTFLGLDGPASPPKET